MRFRFEVLVSLKDGLLDPQGKAVQGALPTLGWSNVSEVRVGKHIALTVDADDEAAATAQVQEMANALGISNRREFYEELGSFGNEFGHHLDLKTNAVEIVFGSPPLPI